MLATLAACALLAGCSAEGGRPVVDGEAVYADFDADGLTAAADLIVDADSPATKTDRSIPIPGHEVTVRADGAGTAGAVDTAVYEITVSAVRKGGDAVRAGDRILVAPAVDPDSDPPASQATLLASARPVTLFLVPAAGQDGVWTTVSPFQGSDVR